MENHIIIEAIEDVISDLFFNIINSQIGNILGYYFLKPFELFPIT